MSTAINKSKIFVKHGNSGGGSGTGVTAVVANYAALPTVGPASGKFYWVSASTGTHLTGLYYSNGVTWEESPADNITVVANYSALPAVATVTGQFYWCSASQGTAWLPGSLGGTYYSAGLYYSNGVTWEFLNVPYNATQAEVNTGTNTDKFVTPATLASATTVVPRTGAAGDIVAYSAANTLSNITASATTGTYLRGAGASTKPIWSTLVLPNSATNKYIPYATGTNTWGESANFQFDGTTLGIGSAPIANIPIYVSASSNSAQQAQIRNANAGTAAYTGWVLSNGTNQTVLRHYGTGFTTSGASFQDGGLIDGQGAGGLSLNCTNGGDIRIYTASALKLKFAYGSFATWSTAQVLVAGTTSANTAPLKFTSGSLLTTKESGTLNYDGNNFYATEASLQEKALVGCIYTQTSSVTVANTVTETSLLTATKTLPVNFFIVGKTLSFKVTGIHSATGSPTIQIRIKLGSTIIADTTAVGTGNSTNAFFEIRGDITCRTTGAGGTVFTQGFYSELGGGSNFFNMTNTTTSTIDTTTTQVLDIMVTWGTANAGNTITSTNGWITIIN